MAMARVPPGESLAAYVRYMQRLDSGISLPRDGSSGIQGTIIPRFNGS